MWEEGQVWEDEPVEHIDIDLNERFDPDKLNPNDWHEVFEWAITMHDKAARIVYRRDPGPMGLEDEVVRQEAATFVRGLGKEMLDRCHHPFSRMVDVTSLLEDERRRRLFSWICDECGETIPDPMSSRGHAPSCSSYETAAERRGRGY